MASWSPPQINSPRNTFTKNCGPSFSAASLTTSFENKKIWIDFDYKKPKTLCRVRTVVQTTALHYALIEINWVSRSADLSITVLVAIWKGKLQWSLSYSLASENVGDASCGGEYLGQVVNLNWVALKMLGYFRQVLPYPALRVRALCYCGAFALD